MKTAFSTPFSVQEGLEMVRRTGAKVICLPLLHLMNKTSELFTVVGVVTQSDDPV